MKSKYGTAAFYSDMSDVEVSPVYPHISHCYTMGEMLNREHKSFFYQSLYHTIEQHLIEKVYIASVSQLNKITEHTDTPITDEVLFDIVQKELITTFRLLNRDDKNRLIKHLLTSPEMNSKTLGTKLITLLSREK